jgi:hypothetical protein
MYFFASIFPAYTSLPSPMRPCVCPCMHTWACIYAYVIICVQTICSEAYLLCPLYMVQGMRFFARPWIPADHVDG